MNSGTKKPLFAEDLRVEYDKLRLEIADILVGADLEYKAFKDVSDVLLLFAKRYLEVEDDEE